MVNDTLEGPVPVRIDSLLPLGDSSSTHESRDFSVSGEPQTQSRLAPGLDSHNDDFAIPRFASVNATMIPAVISDTLAELDEAGAVIDVENSLLMTNYGASGRWSSRISQGMASDDAMISDAPACLSQPAASAGDSGPAVDSGDGVQLAPLALAEVQAEARRQADKDEDPHDGHHRLSLSSERPTCAFELRMPCARFIFKLTLYSVTVQQEGGLLCELPVFQPPKPQPGLSSAFTVSAASGSQFQRNFRAMHAALRQWLVLEWCLYQFCTLARFAQALVGCVRGRADIEALGHTCIAARAEACAATERIASIEDTAANLQHDYSLIRGWMALRQAVQAEKTHRRNQGPTGKVTIVFTDVQGSTNLLTSLGEAMKPAMAMHNTVMRREISRHKGYEVKTEGDAFMVTFRNPADAVQFSIDAQAALVVAKWSDELLEQPDSCIEFNKSGTKVFAGLRVRMGMETGATDCVPDPTSGRMDYHGDVVNKAARICNLARGGEVLVGDMCMEAAREAPDNHLASNASVVLVGRKMLKGFQEAQVLYRVLPNSFKDRRFAGAKSQLLAKAEEVISHSVQSWMSKHSEGTGLDQSVVQQVDQAYIRGRDAGRGEHKAAIQKLRDELAVARASGLSALSGGDRAMLARRSPAELDEMIQVLQGLKDITGPAPTKIKTVVGSSTTTELEVPDQAEVDRKAKARQYLVQCLPVLKDSPQDADTTNTHSTGSISAADACLFLADNSMGLDRPSVPASPTTWPAVSLSRGYMSAASPCTLPGLTPDPAHKGDTVCLGCGQVSLVPLAKGAGRSPRPGPDTGPYLDDELDVPLADAPASAQARQLKVLLWAMRQVNKINAGARQELLRQFPQDFVAAVDTAGGSNSLGPKRVSFGGNSSPRRGSNYSSSNLAMRRVDSVKGLRIKAPPPSLSGLGADSPSGARGQFFRRAKRKGPETAEEIDAEMGRLRIKLKQLESLPRLAVQQPSDLALGTSGQGSL
eukprot:gene8813-1579_t